MVTITLSGRSFEIAPYKIGALRRAAPFVDQLNALFRSEGEKLAKRQAEIASLPDDEREAAISALMEENSVESMLAPIGIVAEIVAIGMMKLDPKYTAAYLLEEEIAFEDQATLMRGMQELLSKSGLAPTGEAPAPSKPAEAEGASSTNSEILSAN